MKKFVLPTLISLAISGSYVFAEEPVVVQEAEAAPVITAPNSVTPPPAVNLEMEKYREAMEKRMAEQQAAIEKRMAEQQEIIKKQIEQQQKQHQEMMEKRNANMQEMMEKRNAKMKKMQELMERNSNNPEEHQRMMDKMQEGRNDSLPPPAWANRAPMAPVPNWNVPYMQPRTNYRHAPAPAAPNGGHHVEVEQSLKNIEKLLQEVIDILKKK